MHTRDVSNGIAWWNSLTEDQRAFYCGCFDGELDLISLTQRISLEGCNGHFTKLVYDRLTGRNPALMTLGDFARHIRECKAEFNGHGVPPQ